MYVHPRFRGMDLAVLIVVDCDPTSPTFGCTVDCGIPSDMPDSWYLEDYDSDGWNAKHRMRFVRIER